MSCMWWSHVTLTIALHIHMSHVTLSYETYHRFGGMSHVVHVMESCHNYDCVAHTYESCHTQLRNLSQIRRNESCRGCDGDMSHLRLRCTYIWVMSRIHMSHVNTTTKTITDPEEWVMSYMWWSHVLHLKEELWIQIITRISDVVCTI